MSAQKDEVECESLNLENLDVEELEHRLEMAVAGVDATEDGCYIYKVSGDDEQ